MNRKWMDKGKLPLCAHPVALPKVKLRTSYFPFRLALFHDCRADTQASDLNLIKSYYYDFTFLQDEMPVNAKFAVCLGTTSHLLRCSLFTGY